MGAGKYSKAKENVILREIERIQSLQFMQKQVNDS